MELTSATHPISAANSARSWSPGEIEFDVLRVFLSERCPLTKRQIEVRTGIDTTSLSTAIDHLCATGRLSRLNTLIESYALPSCDAPSPLGASIRVVPGGAAQSSGTSARQKGR